MSSVEDENATIEGDMIEMRAQMAKSLYEPVVTSPTYDDFSCLVQADSEQDDSRTRSRLRLNPKVMMVFSVFRELALLGEQRCWN